MIGVLRAGEVVFGEGASRGLTKAAARFGRKVFICTDPFLSGTAVFAAALESLVSAGMEVEVFDTGRPEVPVEDIGRAAERAAAFGAECIVGFGGGSSLDLAKTASAVARFGVSIDTFYGEEQIPGPVIPIVAVPTTAGTGSEVSPVAVVQDDSRLLKVGISSRWLIPAIALVDPILTYTCPPGVTAHSGIDAFTHATEAFLARSNRFAPEDTLDVVFVGKNEISDLFARRAIGLIAANLPRAVAHPSDAEARRSMSLASLYAGIAFSAAGTAGAHALQYPLGSATKTPHGLGVGVLLPYVLAGQFSSRVTELAELADVMGVPPSPAATLEERARAAIEAVVSLLRESGLATTIRELGVDEATIGELAVVASGISRLTNNSAATLDTPLMEKILRAAYAGDPEPIVAG